MSVICAACSFRCPGSASVLGSGGRRDKRRPLRILGLLFSGLHTPSRGFLLEHSQWSISCKSYGIAAAIRTVGPKVFRPSMLRTRGVGLYPTPDAGVAALLERATAAA